jgi:hypothetical protein
VSDHDDSIPLLVSCRKITRQTRANTLAARIIREIERLGAFDL